jgi:hypothetical protein
VRAIALAVVASAIATAQYGPKDGRDLPPTDLARIQSGSAAPDFNLPTGDGRAFTLSGFRGRNVVLVFYRGQW